MDPRTTWPALLTALLAGENLTADEGAWAMNEIMSGAATPVQVAGFAVALRAKGESVSEVTGIARGMLDNSTRLQVKGPVVDIVGTGADRAHTVNISTMASIVTAAAGAPVVKHGNRAATSLCGAADVLEKLGVAIDLPPAANAAVFAETGITFCFAPIYHPALRHAAVPRRELGVPTVFNFLGPLTNPARPSAQAVGVFDSRMAGVVAGVFADRGVSALVFRGDDGLDELTISTTSTVWVVREGTATQTTFDPLSIGVPRSPQDALRGGDATFNAAAVHSLLAGQPGPIRDAVLLNAAAALVSFHNAGGPLADSMRDAFAQAAEAVDSGRAADLLARWIEASQAHKPS